jgi:hypothetical protein
MLWYRKHHRIGRPIPRRLHRLSGNWGHPEGASAKTIQLFQSIPSAIQPTSAILGLMRAPEDHRRR